MFFFSKDLLMAIEKAGGVAQIACSSNTTWVLLANGDLYGCGYNNYGQQGSGDTSDVTLFTKRASGVSEVKVGTSGVSTTYKTTSGDLYRCGRYLGQGDGSTSEILTFSKIASNVSSFDCGRGYETWYIDTNGDLYGCGSGYQGQQGNGSTSNVMTFTKRASDVASVKSSGYTTWYITLSGDLYGCGKNDYGQQGSGNTTNVGTFTKRASEVTQVYPTEYNTWYLATNGFLYCSGNTWAASTYTFTSVVNNVIAFSSYGNSNFGYLNRNNDLYMGGTNNYGEQGSGNTSGVTTFTKRASDVKNFICTEGVSWYIDNNSDLYGCGRNSHGQQGSGTSGSGTNVTTFTKRAGNVADVACSAVTTWYVNADDELYGCGLGSSGQQGNGSTNNVLTFENKMQYIN